MHIVVDLKKCQKHGQCIISAPNVFAFDEAGELIFRETPDERERQAVEDAADVCPVQAIVVED